MRFLRILLYLVAIFVVMPIVVLLVFIILGGTMQFQFLGISFDILFNSNVVSVEGRER